MTITVQIKNVYGQEKIYPACDKAKLFASLKGQSTLTQSDIKHIKALGYTIEIKQNITSL